MRLALYLFVQLIFGLVTASAKPIELVVAADGSAKYKTVQEAVMAVPAGSREIGLA